LGLPLGLPDWPGCQGLKLLFGLLAVVMVWLLYWFSALITLYRYRPFSGTLDGLNTRFSQYSGKWVVPITF